MQLLKYMYSSSVAMDLLNITDSRREIKMTPNALAEHFNTSRQAVSKHLRILTECGLIKQEHKGRKV